MELAKVRKDLLLQEGTETSDGFAKPRGLQATENFHSYDTRSGESGTSAFYSHEEGNKYLRIQEQEYKLKHSFRFYYWIIWTYFVTSMKEFLVTFSSLQQ